MPFIRTVARADAAGSVEDFYKTVEGRVGYFPNWAQAFSLRPDVWHAWDGMIRSIRANLPMRTFELATLAAARALRSSYCSLAHGRTLAEKVFDPAAVTAIATGADAAPLDPGERALMAFAEKIAIAADRVTPADVDALRAHGYADETIFDIAAAAAARCFFAKLLDALGVQADARFNALEPAMRDALTVGRPVAET
jgi:uncharacterized peroxidase-related enzyme